MGRSTGRNGEDTERRSERWEPGEGNPAVKSFVQDPF